MAANLQPIFPKDLKFTFTGNIITANTAKDGTGTVNLLATGGVNGSKLDQLKAQAKGTNVASVARFFLNNGSDPTVAANNSLVHSVSLPAITILETAIMVGDNIDITIVKNTTETACPIPYIPPGYRVYVVIGTTVAAGWQFSAWQGDY